MSGELSFEEKYEILGSKNMTYEGAFITCVRTTGIFCRPSCRARKPKAENVFFVKNTQDALRHGFRPCKICRPMENPNETPAYIKNLINELQQNPYLRLKDQDLRDRSIEPSQIRRWFQQHHKVTFHGYQRMIRLNQAYREIKKGKRITDSAYDSGYDSLSGFNDGYKTIFGHAPSSGSDKKVLNIKRFTTPIGPMYACANNDGLCLLEFTDRRMLENEFKDLQKRLNCVILPGEHPILDQTEKEVQEYFEGNRTSFSILLNTPGTDFQQHVWQLLTTIPYGKTRSYKEQAINLGNLKAIRAVATANGMNRIAIVIPCHRVIGSDGNLTGYAGGLPRKKFLLEHEKNVLGVNNQIILEL